MRCCAVFWTAALIGRQIPLAELLEHLLALFQRLLDVLRRDRPVVRIESRINEGGFEIGDVRLPRTLDLDAEPGHARVQARFTLAYERFAEVALSALDFDRDELRLIAPVAHDLHVGERDLEHAVFRVFLGDDRCRLVRGDVVEDGGELALDLLPALVGGEVAARPVLRGLAVFGEHRVDRVDVPLLARLLQLVAHLVRVGAGVVADHERVEDVEVGAAERAARVRDRVASHLGVAQPCPLLRSEIAHHFFDARLLVVVPVDGGFELVPRARRPDRRSDS